MSVKFDFKGLEEPFEADWPVTINVPQNGGTVEEQTFVARFRCLSEDELGEVRKSPEPDAFINAFFVGLAKDEGPEFTPALRKLMLQRPYVRMGLITAYTSFNQGIAVKN